MDTQPRPGEGSAIASVIFGTISCVLVIVTYLASAKYRLNLYIAIPAGVCGFTGIILAHIAKRKGNYGNLRIAGTILSWVGAVFSMTLCGVLINLLTAISRYS